MPSRSRVAMCSGSPRRASSAACSRGCSVFTRPPRISSWPVNSETSVTSRPASRSAVAVPPVERTSTPSAASPFAKSATPVLSETEISARRTFTCPLPRLSCWVSGAGSVIDRDRPRVAGVDPNPALRDHADRLGIQLVLDRVDRRLQLLAADPGGHQDLALGDHRTGVDPLVDEVDGDAGGLDAGGESLADRVEAGEARQQGGVDVDD